MQSLVYATLLLSLASFSPVDSSHWDYGEFGPDVWSEQYPTCNGESQSPINIRTKCTIERTFSKINLSSSHQSTLLFRLRNNGHTITAETVTEQDLTLTGVNLNGVFRFDSFHIHWGPNKRSGSEHRLFVFSLCFCFDHRTFFCSETASSIRANVTSSTKIKKQTEPPFSDFS